MYYHQHSTIAAVCTCMLHVNLQCSHSIDDIKNYKKYRVTYKKKFKKERKKEKEKKRKTARQKYGTLFPHQLSTLTFPLINQHPIHFSSSMTILTCSEHNKHNKAAFDKKLTHTGI